MEDRILQPANQDSSGQWTRNRIQNSTVHQGHVINQYQCCSPANTEKEDERCLQRLCTTNPCNDKARIESNGGGLLAASYRWILENSDFQLWRDNQQSRLLWIKGDPGKGKTMLLCGIINELQKSITEKTHLSYFFCQATDSGINNATAVLRNLLHSLAEKQPSLISHIRKEYDHGPEAVFEDRNAWEAISKVFGNILRDPSLNNTYLIIDALDECVTDRRNLLRFIATQSSTSSRVKWIVSSRNWPDIEEELECAEYKTRLSLELNAELVAAAVNVFIQQKVCQLAQKKHYTLEMQNAVLQHLTSNANDTFLWVALVCQDLEKTPKFDVLEKLDQFPPGLDSLYRQMLDQIRKSSSFRRCLQVLAVTAVLYRPVTVAELVALVKQPAGFVNDLESVREIISFCGSFLTLRDDIVYFIHQSAKDFLITQASNEVFLDGVEYTHQEIFAKSLSILHEKLGRDIYNLQAPGCPIEDVKQPRPDPLAVSRYPCVYWVDHFCDSKHEILAHGTTILTFFEKQYLYWLEALSLCRSMAKGVVSMTKLWHLFQGLRDTDALKRIVYDARRFIMYHKEAIENYPLQAYASALLFSPTDSKIRRLFRHEEPREVTIKPAISNGWSACMQTLEGHSRYFTSAAFSNDSTRLASGSDDGTVKIWDAGSGACVHTLEGHSDVVTSVAFLHDSTRLASGSKDGTVKIWDTSSEACLHTLEGHRGGVTSMAFSRSETWLASAFYNIIKIWDASSGDCQSTFEAHSMYITSVAFSHGSAWLASGSGDGTIKIWDARSGTCLHTLEGHSMAVTLSVAFSHDSTRLASVSNDCTVKIWDTSSETCLHTLKGHSSSVNSVAFSHDSTQLASASRDNTVKIWDTSSEACLHTLKGHSAEIKSVAFSPDSTRLASASYDNTVKIWDVSSGARPYMLEGHNSYITSVVFSPNSAWLASASNDCTVKIWDASSGTLMHTLKGHCDNVYLVAFSHDSTQLASGSRDNTVKIWDTSSGTLVHTLESHSRTIKSVAFSRNPARLASACDRTIKIWDTSSGKCLQTLGGHSRYFTSVAFSHDLTRLASTCSHTIKIWNTSSGKCLRTICADWNCINSAAFSHDSTRLASASRDNTVKIWDTRSGVCLQNFDVGRYHSHLSFNSTGTLLHTDRGTIAISSFQVTDRIDIPASKPQYQGASISSDGNWIMCAGSNILWIPSEYRPSRSAVSGTQVGMGAGSGRVWVCRVT